MWPLSDLAQLAQAAFYLALTLSVPVLVVGAAFGAGISVLQTAFQIQDAAIGQLVRLLAIGAVLLLAGPWMGDQIAAFAEHALAPPPP